DDRSKFLPWAELLQRGHFVVEDDEVNRAARIGNATGSLQPGESCQFPHSGRIRRAGECFFDASVRSDYFADRAPGRYDRRTPTADGCKADLLIGEAEINFTPSASPARTAFLTLSTIHAYGLPSEN